MVVVEKPIEEVIREHQTSLATPYYLIDEHLLLKNLQKIAMVREKSDAKSVLALKCFSTWSVFGLMSQYMDGTTSSSLYEAKLGHEKFGKEVHAYSVGFSKDEIEEIKKFATKVIFNSLSQLKQFIPLVEGIPVGLRINPGVSYSHFDLADPARRYCRLGAAEEQDINEVLPHLSGVMFHCNCENDDFEKFSSLLDHIGKKYGPILKKLQWVSLGGGIYFTKEGYPLDKFSDRLSRFSKEFDVQVYLEPGEASITRSGFLVTSVIDMVHNEQDIAIVDAAVETHMPDLMIYKSDAKIEAAQPTGFPTMITGRTCLAGDVFGTYNFPSKLKVGDLVTFADAAGYTMVKKNWFNGIKMPSIVVRRLDGRVELVRVFTYEDFVNNLS